MQRDFNKHHMTQVPITVNQLANEKMQMLEVSEHVGMNYPVTPDSRYVTQQVDNFLIPWVEGSVENPNTIKEDVEFSEPKTPVSDPPRQPAANKAKPALRSI